MVDSRKALRLWPLFLLMLSYPLGPAAQNLAALLAGLAFLYSLWQQPQARLSLKQALSQKSLWALLALVVWNSLRSAFAPVEGGHQEPLSYAIGFLPLVVLPLLALALRPLSDREQKHCLAIVASILFLWGLVSFSQYLWPWKIQGAALSLGGIGRAQGFYSHPMSLAYASLFLWPWALRLCLQEPRSIFSWLILLGSGMNLVFAMSRITQLLMLLFFILNVFLLLRQWRQRLRVFVFGLLGLIIVLNTKNPISLRFQNLLQADRIDRSSAYADDRLAFWHAHAVMIQEKPWLGHGIHLGLAYREPYYAKIGLADFPKKFPAHNQYLQLLVEGGAIALLLFGLWMFWLWQEIGRSVFSRAMQGHLKQGLAIFLLGGLTQNAFSDTTVRMGLCLLLIVCFQGCRYAEEKPV